jgi:LuxR family maltose regulon positive regulatory protein
MIGHLLEHAPPFVLVIDDIHHIDDADSTALVEQLGDRLPADSTLVLVGRAHHGSSATRLRLRPGVIDVSAADLAFDLGETEQMMHLLGLEPDIDDVTTLFGHFEGWPAGLRLAALARKRADDLHAANPFAELERSPFVTRYVMSEWLGRLRPDDRELLGGAACLRRFTADMCDAIIGRTRSAGALARLAHEEAMVVPLDQQDDWFRMHPVLSDALSDELRSRDPTTWQAIHVGAAHWWADKGDAELSIEHAFTGGDVELGEALIIEHAPQYMSRGLCSTVRRWLDDLGDRMLSSPVLCSLAAVLAVQMGDGERATEFMDLLHGLVADETDEMTNRIDVVRAAVEPCRPSAAIELSASVASLPVGGWRVMARWVRGVNLFLVGDPDALRDLRGALAESEVAELAVTRANLLATISIIHEIEGRREAADELALRAQDQVGRQRAETLSTTAVVSSATAVAAARRGRQVDAREAMALARRHYHDIEAVATWLNIIGRIALVRACLLLDDAAQGRELLGELRRLRAGDDRIEIDDHLDELAAEIAAASAVLNTRWQSLTDAELRVLRHLPTNLNLSDIATRLFVSRNTVKSHTAAIYRKLGASSRTEAVELAREAGLLAGE